ncbi:hypothetical protein [Sphingosinicella sp. BN140058]|uniref:hypothetical protein n=1 Tax=Sphingosinicella sp. BN140058 TaxID=1892855 RepID=UPI001010BDDE|nr:hypothetical protein [Sphingosinicella sp. BN140058]QAY76615.1 hypothetical protein ETR14_08980 [Sphingosinicella sp. BN140058]
MRKLLIMLSVTIAGLGVGGGAAYATSMFLAPPAPADHSGPTAFVPAGKILAPLVLKDGRLSGYVSFTVELEVGADVAEDVQTRLPLLLNAVNMRTYKTPMAAGPDGLLPDIGTFRKVVMAAADEAFGKGVVRRAAITQANPV